MRIFSRRAILEDGVVEQLEVKAGNWGSHRCITDSNPGSVFNYGIHL
jgi:hypothetical protein